MTDRQQLIEDFWAALDDSPFMMIGLPDQNAHSEPMAAQFDTRGNPIWFYTRKDNRLIHGMRENRNAMAQYVAKDHKLFACISGTVMEVCDPNIIDRYWSNSVEAWYDGGKNDPMLTMIRFDMHSAEIWRNDPSLTGRLKMVFGGDIEQEELGSDHATVAMA